MSFLKEYERLKELGKGAFAKVYKVRHNELGYIRAIRVLNEIVDNENDKLYRTFLKECQVLLKLGNGGHPNIVRIYQPRLLQNHALVEMDYIEGYDLDDYLKKHRFIPVEDVLRFVSEISSALAYCHVDIYEFLMDREVDQLPDDPDDGNKVLVDDETRRRLIRKYGITHNDLHSKNIMRRRYDGSYILLDFGLAIQNGKAVKSSSRRDGAVEYKAPEKWDNDSVISEQSDVYSFGILMYEMLAGQLPFPFEQDKYSNELQALNELREHHLRTIPPAIEPLRREAYESVNPGKVYIKDYPEQLETIILKCLEKKPENRYANAKELHEEIKMLLVRTQQTDSAELIRLKARDKDLKEELNSLSTEKDELNEQINRLAKQLAKATFDADNTEILRLRDRVNLLEEQLNATPDEVNKLKKEIKNLESDIDKLESELIETKSNRKNNPVWMILCIVCTLLFGFYCWKYYTQPSSASDINTYSSETNDYKSIISEQKEQMDSLQKQLIEKDNTITALKKNSTPSASNNTVITEKDNEIERLKKENTTLKSSANAKDSEISTLQREKNSLNATLKEKNNEISGLRKTIENL